MKILGLLLILTIAVGCKKDEISGTPILGHSYHLRDGIYGYGDYQPKQPVEYVGLHGDTVLVKSQVDWSKFVYVPTNGVKYFIVQANQIRVNDPNFIIGDTTKIIWYLQEGDLTY